MHGLIPFSSSLSKTVERFERRILEEFTKMFQDSNYFYFSLTGDITNALQRQMARVPVTTMNSTTGEPIELFPTWRDVDDRFFFNRSMVEDLIEIGDQRLDAWITPFIQVLGRSGLFFCRFFEQWKILPCHKKIFSWHGKFFFHVSKYYFFASLLTKKKIASFLSLLRHHD